MKKRLLLVALTVAIVTMFFISGRVAQVDRSVGPKCDEAQTPVALRLAR